MRTIRHASKEAMRNTPEFRDIVYSANVHISAGHIWENFGPFSTREDVLAHVLLLRDDAASAFAAEMSHPDVEKALQSREARQLVAHFLEGRLLTGNLAGIVGGTS